MEMGLRVAIWKFSWIRLYYDVKLLTLTYIHTLYIYIFIYLFI